MFSVDSQLFFLSVEIANCFSCLLKLLFWWPTEWSLFFVVGYEWPLFVFWVTVVFVVFVIKWSLLFPYGSIFLVIRP